MSKLLSPLSVAVRWVTDIFWMHRPYQLSNRLNDNPVDPAGRRALTRMLKSKNRKIKEGGLWVFQELVEPPIEDIEHVYHAVNEEHLASRWYAIQWIASNPRTHPTDVLQSAVAAANVFYLNAKAKGLSVEWFDDKLRKTRQELNRRSKH